jgi:uncharacterized membrane protein
MGTHSAEQSVEIDAPPESCFAAAIDYETFPRWQQAVERAEVLERDSEGRGELVRFEIDAKVKKISYTLRYHYDAPAASGSERAWRIWWEFVEGDGVADVEGDYVLEPLDGGRRTLVAYRLGIDPGVPVPGVVARRLNRGVMRRSVTDLRDEVERRAAS